MGAETPSDVNDHDTLKYSLLGPSLTKSGQDNVDQQKVKKTIISDEVFVNPLLGLRNHLQRVSWIKVLQ